MTQKSAHRPGLVDGGILVDRVSGQPFRHKLGRGHRARGHEQGGVRCRALNSFQQGDQRERFADACRVAPDEFAVGPCHGRVTEPLAKAGVVLLAAPPPMGEPGVDDRSGDPARAAIERRARKHTQHQTVCSSRAASAGSTGGAPTRRSASCVRSFSVFSSARRHASIVSSSASRGTWMGAPQR